MRLRVVGDTVGVVSLGLVKLLLVYEGVEASRVYEKQGKWSSAQCEGLQSRVGEGVTDATGVK